MKVLICGVNYAPEKTGTGKFTADLAEWLASQGHEVHAVVGPPHYPEWKVYDGFDPRHHSVEQLRGVTVHRVPMFVPSLDELNSKKRIRMELSFSFHSLRPWMRRLAGKRFDVVIAVCPPMQVASMPWVYRGLQRVPWVFHIQDLQVDAAFRLGMLKPGRSERVLQRIERFFLRKATRVSTITEAMRQRIIAKGVPRDRVWLVPNWSDVHAIQPSSRENSFRAAVGAGPGDILCLYAGNFGKKQGLDLIVQAAHKLRDNLHYKFVIVGSGADEPNVKALAAELKVPNLQFLPVQPMDVLPQMLAAADIHLVVQKHEAADLVMPSKLTNILAAGRPSLATANPGTTLHDVLTTHDAGVCVPYGDVEQFCSALKQMSIDEEGRIRMGRNARAYAEQFLDKDVILARFERQLQELIAGEGKRRPKGAKKNVPSPL